MASLALLGLLLGNGGEMGILMSVQALFEKHKGVNDWHMELVGEIQDLKFVEESESVYTVSKDGLLGLFNTANQDFEWKKRLTAVQKQGDSEEFHLRYLSRNLLVFSQRRAMLLNTAGHANMEIDFGSIFGTAAVKAFEAGKGTPLADLINYHGSIVTCFLFGNKAVFYQNAQYWDSVTLDDELDAATTDNEQIEVLEMLYDQSSQRLTVLVKVNKNTLKSVVIDLQGMAVEGQAKVPASEGMSDVARTLSFFVVRSSKDTSVLDPQTLQSVYSTKAESVQTSITDDFLLVQDSVGKAKIVDLKASGGDQSVEIAAAGEAGGCSPLVRHASTQGTLTTVKMAQSCQSNLQIITYDDGTTTGASPSYDMEMETQSLSLPSNG